MYLNNNPLLGTMQLEAPPVDQAEYTAYRTATDLREPYRSIKLFGFVSYLASLRPTQRITWCVTQQAYAQLSQNLAQCRVPLSYLRDTKKFVVPDLPEAPLIVFINSRSGGRAGPALTETLFHALGHSQVWFFCWHFLRCRLEQHSICILVISNMQVYDLREYRPGPVLQKIYANLAVAIQMGDRSASIVRRYERLCS